MTPTEQRRAWAYAMVSRCKTPPPAYGSSEWLELPDSSVEKVAAVVIAAESWALEGDFLEQTLRVEIEALQRAHKAADDAEFRDRRDGHREAWTGSGFQPDERIADDIEREWREWVGGAV